MSMNYAVRWPKEWRQKAKETDKAMFCVSVDGSTCAKDRLGRAEFVGPMDQGIAAGLAIFAMRLQTGSTPEEAFAAADWRPVAERPTKAEIAERNKVES